jgi:hypothetical protein
VTADRPHSGDDTYDLLDDALYQLAERRGKWLGDPLATITLLASLTDQAERMLPEHVLEARDNGSTWHESPPPSPPAPNRPNSATAPTRPSPTADGHTTTNTTINHAT